MTQVCHILGNGESARLFKPIPKNDILLTCNLPPFPVENVYATTMVDFKIMRAVDDGSLIIPGKWILGARPHIHLKENPNMYIRFAAHIKEFYLVKPDYVPSFHEFSCGHMAAHYACSKFKPKECHLYGFDSIFGMDLYSCSDLYLFSDRSTSNNVRLAHNWREIWPHQFKEFPDTTFYLHYFNNDIKLNNIPNNVKIIGK